MHWIDWTIIAAYLVWIVWDGIRLTRNSTGIEGYFLAGRRLPWWAIGLSVMATQLSAITMIGTTGQAYDSGMRFIQYYYALPLAMILISVLFVPFFHRARIYTAYEYLERRFDVKTRAFASFLFLVSRAMACGVVISAPAVVMAIVLGWDFALTCLAIGLPTAIYTMFGGVEAVAWTDVKQMVLIVFSLVAVFAALAFGLPDNVSMRDALTIAGAAGRLQTFDFSFDFSKQYTFWSGTIAALFLFLAYFGTDQSQVQRYLTAKSVAEARTSLLMSAYWKIPLQALVLLVGVFLFMFYLFTPPPLVFNPQYERTVRHSARAADYSDAERRFSDAHRARGDAALALARAGELEFAAAAQAFTARDREVAAVRREATEIIRDAAHDRAFSDVNYVFPTFVMSRLPVGLVGLVIAGIFAAAMSTISAELASLSTATVIDFYRRFRTTQATDDHYLLVSRIATGAWGLFACIVAIYAAELGSLIEVVNRFGSLFYGSILGVFLLAIGTRYATGNGAFIGLLAGMASVGYVATVHPWIAFLWHNVIGVLVVLSVGSVVSLVDPARRRERSVSA